MSEELQAALSTVDMLRRMDHESKGIHAPQMIALADEITRLSAERNALLQERKDSSLAHEKRCNEYRAQIVGLSDELEAANSKIEDLHFELKRHVNGHVICMKQRDAARDRCAEFERAVEAKDAAVAEFIKDADAALADCANWFVHAAEKRVLPARPEECLALIHKADRSRALLAPAPQIAGEAKCHWITPEIWEKPTPAPPAACTNCGKTAHDHSNPVVWTCLNYWPAAEGKCVNCGGHGFIEWTAGGETRLDPCVVCKPVAGRETQP